MASILAKCRNGALLNVLLGGLVLVFLKIGRLRMAYRWLELERAKFQVNIALCDKLKSQI